MKIVKIKFEELEQGSYFRHLFVSYKERLLTEGVHKNHAGVPVIPIGWRTGLRKMVLENIEGRGRKKIF